MALHYLDTSVAVPAFVREASTSRVQSFLASLGPHGLAISPWVTAEFASALGLKRRMGSIGAPVHTGALARWRAFADHARSIDIGRRDFETASRLCERHDLGLRAADALHLAIAMANDCKLVTLDQQLAAAAGELGVPVASP